MFNQNQGHPLPTITTDPVMIEEHREKVIAHQEYCKKLVEILIEWWMDKISAQLALPYVLQKINFAENQKEK